MSNLKKKPFNTDIRQRMRTARSAAKCVIHSDLTPITRETRSHEARRREAPKRKCVIYSVRPI